MKAKICASCGGEFTPGKRNYARAVTCSNACNLKKWRAENHERSLQIKRDWRKRNPGREYPGSRRWAANNPERLAHLKARRYAREKGAEGSHTFDEWQELKIKHDNCCVDCGIMKPLTKDHIIPLSKGGSDYITNIQPMCRNCNSRKYNKEPICL